ncbi:MAG: DNA repair protein RecO [Patescibacteria group bacterium]
MSYIRDEVIVLKKMPFREYDRQYVLYGKDYGLLIAVARGSMKIQAKQAAQLEPLHFADVMIAKGKAYDHLAVAISAGKDHKLKNLSSYAAAGAFADFCLHLLRPGVADDRIFELWEELLRTLSKLDAELSSLRAELVYAAAVLKFLDLLGYGPMLKICGACGQVAGPTDVFYAPDHNGLICQDCQPKQNQALIRLEARAVVLLGFLRTASLSDVLRVTAPIAMLQTVIALTREISKHAPFEFEPHGFRSIAELITNNQQNNHQKINNNQ